MENESIPVLLVDDDEDDYVIIRDLLSEIQDKKFILDWEPTYDAALSIIRLKKHRVYLLDYRLGERSGLDLLHDALRQGCEAPMILLTGRGDTQIDAQALRIGAADYLVKGQIDSSLLERSIRYSMKHKGVEAQLRKAVEELKRSNTDLEQFAYVASHELKEPLNMVVSYLQLLEKRYHEKLDRSAEEFIRFAVEGGTRMQSLVNDLLEYSRVGIRGKPFKRVDSNEALKRALSYLSLHVKESRAMISQDVLPVVLGEETQLVQVFQNLIGNAIKFRGDRIPRIHVGAEGKDNSILFFVRDNGIGIDAAYADRIFLIFQRLHSRTSYPGTGIGLAISKRIVERHGGQIWFESRPGDGTTFYFSIPARRESIPEKLEAGCGQNPATL